MQTSDDIYLFDILYSGILQVGVYLCPLTFSHRFIIAIIALKFIRIGSKYIGVAQNCTCLNNSDLQ